mgnify:CR=1 FL=1
MDAIQVETIKKTNKPIPKFSTAKIELILIDNDKYSLAKVEYENGEIENRLYYKRKDNILNIANILWDIYADKNIFHLQWCKGNTPLFDCINPKSKEQLFCKLNLCMSK